MAKITLTDLTNLSNETSVVNAINNNNAAIEAAIENTLSRDGTTPNEMESNLDMNNKRILNLADATWDQEPCTFKQLKDAVIGTLTVTVTDHGLLAGLLDDDHSQYHNDTRGDARYSRYTTSRTNLKAIDTTKTTSCYLTESGRQGLFVWKTGNFSSQISLDTQEGVFIKANAIASTVGSWVRDDYQDGVQATWFGAIADGSTNNYTSLACWLDVAQALQVPALLTGGPLAYRYGTTLTMTTLVPVIGAGTDQSVFEYTGAAEAIKILPPLYSASYTSLPSHEMRSFTVRHSTPGSGTYGMSLTTSVSGYPYSQFLWENIEVGVFGTRSILLNNTSATDGIFAGKFVNVFAHGGWQATNLGDSVTLSNCRVYGTSSSQNLSITMIAGARELLIENCSLVTTGGLYFDSCNGVRFLYNHVEIGDAQNFTGVSANLEFNNCSQISIRGGRIAKIGTGTQPTYTILLGGTTSSVLVEEVDLVKGSGAHIYAPATTNRVVVNTSTCTFDTTASVTLQGTNSYLSTAWGIPTGAGTELQYRNSTSFGAVSGSSVTGGGQVSLPSILGTSPSLGVGYTTGSGGSVTQATSKTTGVTLNTLNGAVTMNSAALGASTAISFTLTNSSIGANDNVLWSIKSGATAAAYIVLTDQISAGSCRVMVFNRSGGSLSEAIVLAFTVVKGSIT